MSFDSELNEVKEFFYVSQMRYKTSNKYLEHLQKINKYPQISEETRLYIGKEPPIPQLKNNVYSIKVGDYKTSLKKHIRLLVNNCIVLLVSLWEIYCKEKKIKKYNDDNIVEIILYRNCIVHNKSKINENYLTNSKLMIYKLGDELNFNENDFEKFLKYFEGK